MDGAVWLRGRGGAAGVGYRGMVPPPPVAVGSRSLPVERRASGQPLVSHFATVQMGWNQLTAGPLPDETDLSTALAMQRSGIVPANGAVVSVDIPSAASHFKHRTECVYLPPAWLSTAAEAASGNDDRRCIQHACRLDPVRFAVATVDSFAAAHGGIVAGGFGLRRHVTRRVMRGCFGLDDSGASHTHRDNIRSALTSSRRAKLCVTRDRWCRQWSLA